MSEKHTEESKNTTNGTQNKASSEELFELKKKLLEAYIQGFKHSGPEFNGVSTTDLEKSELIEVLRFSDFGFENWFQNFTENSRGDQTTSKSLKLEHDITAQNLKTEIRAVDASELESLVDDWREWSNSRRLESRASVWKLAAGELEDILNKSAVKVTDHEENNQ